MLYDEENNSFQEEDNTTKPLNQSQKIAVSVLALFAIMAIGLWFVQFKKNIVGSIATDINYDNQDEASASIDEALKNKDTDSDGLTDWDETNIYKTSAYLSDSDSDGILDIAEIEKGTDPNCPTGQNCYNSSTGKPASSTAGSLLSQQQAQAENGASLTNNLSSLTQAEAQLFLSGKADVSTVRDVFIKTGTSKSEMDKIGDAILMQNYQTLISQLLASNSISASTSSINSISGAQSANTNLESVLSGQTDVTTLRQLLLKAGMQKELLDKISDEDLMSTYMSTIEKK